jgi:hypothetical protein
MENTFETRQAIKKWLDAGYAADRVAAILVVQYDLVVDVQQNGVGEEPQFEYIEETIKNEEGEVLAHTTRRSRKSTPPVINESDASITE